MNHTVRPFLALLIAAALALGIHTTFGQQAEPITRTITTVSGNRGGSPSAAFGFPAGSWKMTFQNLNGEGNVRFRAVGAVEFKVYSNAGTPPSESELLETEMVGGSNESETTSFGSTTTIWIQSSYELKAFFKSEDALEFKAVLTATEPIVAATAIPTAIPPTPTTIPTNIPPTTQPTAIPASATTVPTEAKASATVAVSQTEPSATAQVIPSATSNTPPQIANDSVANAPTIQATVQTANPSAPVPQIMEGSDMRRAVSTERNELRRTILILGGVVTFLIIVLVVVLIRRRGPKKAKERPTRRSNRTEQVVEPITPNNLPEAPRPSTPDPDED